MAKNPPTKRQRAGHRIKRPNVSFLSLLPKGASKIPGLFRSEKPVAQTEQPLMRLDEERGILTTLVYVPNRADSWQDHMKPEDVEHACHSWMKNGCKLDIQHNLKELRKDQAYALESFIVQPGDERFEGWQDRDGNDLDATGAWAALIKIEDEKLLDLARKGKLNETSLYCFGGDYQLAPEALEKGDDNSPEEGEPMNQEQFDQLLGAVNALKTGHTIWFSDRVDAPNLGNPGRVGCCSRVQILPKPPK